MFFNKKALLTTIAAALIGSFQAVAQDAQSGVKDLEAGRYNKAIQTFQGLASSAPSADNYFYLGYAQLKAGNVTAAKEAFSKGASADAKNQLNNIGLAMVALANKDRATAKTLIDEALKATKNKDMTVLLRAGEAYTLFDANDPAEAIRILDIADKLDKKNQNAEVEMALGDAYLIKNDGGNAVSKYENALMITPNSAEAQYKIGKVFLRGKNYQKAQENYEKAIAADPEYAPTYEDLAEAFFGSRAYKSAARNMDLYIQKSQTTDVDKLLRSAQFDFLAGDNMRAIQKLDVLKGKVNTPVINRIYGWAYNNMGKYEEAIQSLTNFIQQAPEKVISDDYKFLGRAYAQRGTPEGDSLGIAFLEKAAPMDTVENLYREVGKAYFGAKKFDKAAEAYTKAIAYDTAKATSNDYFQLGYSNFFMMNKLSKDMAVAGADTNTLKQQKEQYYKNADMAFGKVNQISKDWSPGYYWRAQTNYFAFPREQAMSNGVAVPHYEMYLDIANKEVAADPAKKESNKKNMMTAYKFLYQYYTSKNDAAKAKEYLSRASELDPADADVQNILNPKPAKPAAPAKPTPPKKSTR